MIYLKEFNTQAEYDAAVESGEIKAPSVSLINDPYALKYKQFIPLGLYVQHIDGTLYTEDQWAASGLSGDLANGVAVVNENASFVIAKSDIEKRTWGPTGNVAGVATYENDSNLAKTDYQGKKNTKLITEKWSDCAAQECVDFIFPNGQHGYLPGAGEWNIVNLYYTEITRILGTIGGTQFNTSNAYYWSSTLYSSNIAWAYNLMSQYTRMISSMARGGNAFVRPFTTL